MIGTLTDKAELLGTLLPTVRLRNLKGMGWGGEGEGDDDNDTRTETQKMKKLHLRPDSDATLPSGSAQGEHPVWSKLAQAAPRESRQNRRGLLSKSQSKVHGPWASTGAQ